MATPTTHRSSSARSSVDGHVYAFSAANGDLLWSFGTGSYVYASPAVWRGLVLVGSYDHDFYALDEGTGSLRWSFHANARPSPEPPRW
jgi:outer membrane protein assembly factor BamB